MKYGRGMRAAACIMALVLLLLSMIPAALAEQAQPGVTYKQVEVTIGTVTMKANANVRRKPDADSEREGHLAPGESCVIIGESGDWWQVEFNGKTCYVLKSLLDVSTEIRQVEVIVEDPLQTAVSGVQPPTLLEYRNEYRIKGTVRSNIPMIEVSVEIYNLRSMEVERKASVRMKREDDVREYDLSKFAGEISFNKLAPGEKKLIVRVNSTNESAAALEMFFYIRSEKTKYSEPRSITGDCRLSVPHGDRSDLTDGSHGTGCELRSQKESISVRLPEDKKAGGLLLCWRSAPENMRIEMLDANNAVLETIEEENPDGMIHLYYTLHENTAKILISTGNDVTLCELRVYEKGYVPEVVQQWQPIPEKVDLLVISAHQDDEMLFYGGTIPYYSAQGKTVAVVYMANCGRKRYAEALDGLWSCGLKYHPVFVGFEDARLERYERALNLWGEEATQEVLIELIRRYKPEVIVTHDVNGEYGHNQHKVTSAMVSSSVAKAGDPAIFPESAQQYGAWTPKKLYIHLYEENAVFMDIYDQPSEAFGGMSMTQVATIGYSKHVSQLVDFSMEKHGVTYDNRKYGLAFTTVGYDVEKNDFFENID